jgi:acetolactate synthase-1/2/3 large subunit
MLGMHGTYEANLAMHGCDVMINIGARFDDRITGRLDAFSPGSKKIHVDIDPSSINKNVASTADRRRCGHRAGRHAEGLEGEGRKVDKKALKPGGAQIDEWRARNCLAYKPNSNTTIKPQYAIERLYQADQGARRYITTEVGQHQMWAAQFLASRSPTAG